MSFLQAVEVVKNRSISEHMSQPVINFFEQHDSLSLSHSSGNITKQQKFEIARREQEIRAMKEQTEARRLENDAKRLEIEAKRQENEAKHLEFMQNLFYD